MISCWLLELKDGVKIIVSENVYEKVWKKKGKTKIEEHWFSANDCIKKNRGVPIYGLEPKTDKDLIIIIPEQWDGIKPR